MQIRANTRTGAWTHLERRGDRELADVHRAEHALLEPVVQLSNLVGQEPEGGDDAPTR